MKSHPILKGVLIALLVLILAAGAALYVLFGTQWKAANSIEKVGDDLWVMEYEGDYGFDEFLAQGGASSDAEMGNYIASYLTHGLWKPDTTKIEKVGCSVLMAKDATESKDATGATESTDATESKGATDAQGALFGRNYDWADCKAMIVHTKPKNGYESFSTVCLDFLGFGDEWTPDAGMGNKFMALAATYVPLDGMNEKGLCIADLQVEPGEVIHQDTDKPDITLTAAIRLCLDKAATVDEALTLLEKYDMNFSINSAHHFAIMDSTGRSVAVEWIGDEMFVTETGVVTNHYVVGDAEPDLEDVAKQYRPSYIRRDRLSGIWLDHDGELTEKQVKDAMKSVAASNFNEYRAPGESRRTQWTLICDSGRRTATLYRNEDYGMAYKLAFGESEFLTQE